MNSDRATTDRLLDLVRKHFGLVENDELSDDLAKGSIPEWDSLGHVELINKVQEEFGVELDLEQLAGIGTIADLRRILALQTC